jgi:hypothetical protein
MRLSAKTHVSETSRRRHFCRILQKIAARAGVVAVRAFLGRGGRRADNRYAANEMPVREVRSFAADVLEVFSDDEKLWGETIAERLRASFDDAYGRASSATCPSRSSRSASRASSRARDASVPRSPKSSACSRDPEMCS